MILSFHREKQANFTTAPFRTGPSCGPAPFLSQLLPTTPHPIHILISDTLGKMLFSNVPTKEEKSSSAFRACHQKTSSAFGAGQAGGCRCGRRRQASHTQWCRDEGALAIQAGPIPVLKLPKPDMGSGPSPQVCGSPDLLAPGAGYSS